MNIAAEALNPFGQAEYCLIADKQGQITNEDVTRLLSETDLGGGYFVLHASQLNSELGDAIHRWNWTPLQISNQSCRAMEKYLTAAQNRLSETQRRVLLMQIFISGDTRPAQSITTLESGDAPLFYSQAPAISRPAARSRPALFLCTQQPCRCSPDAREQERVLEQLTQERGVKLVKTRCVGLCSPKGAGLLVRPATQSARYLDDLYFASTSTLKTYLEE